MTDNDSTAQFIASLVKSLQALCHGYVDFQKNIEIIGHIYINVDSQQKFDYIVNEQVCKNGDESPAMFVSNSFHALPNHKPVRTFVQNDAPLDLKTIVAKDVSGVDLSTFHSDTGQGRSTSRESSQSLSAGSECGSLSGNIREPISSSSRQNPENYVSRRKRHLNNVSSKHSPTASPTPPSRNQEGERRDAKDSPMLRSQYTLGASASKLARRISSELERQSLPNPAYPSDSEIQARLSSPSDHSRPDPGAYQRHYPGGSRPHPDPMNDPTSQEGSLEEGIDLTRVKEEVVDEEQLFDQFDWAHGTRDTGQDTSFPRTGPDDPSTEGPTVEGEETDRGETSPSSALYPVMLHHNTAGLPGYGSPVFPQNFSDTPHTMSASSSPVPSTSGQPSPGGGGGGGFPARRQQSGHAGRGLSYVDFIPPPHFSAIASLGYREKLKHDNPVKWMNYMWKERERVRKERAILKERDDEQALLKKERIRIQNRLRKRKERQRKRERDMLSVLKSEPGSLLQTSQLTVQSFDPAMKTEPVAIHPAFRGLSTLP